VGKTARQCRYISPRKQSEGRKLKDAHRKSSGKKYGKKRKVWSRFPVRGTATQLLEKKPRFGREVGTE